MEVTIVGRTDDAIRDVLTADQENSLPDGDFALVYTDSDGNKVRKFPIHDETRVRAAISYFSAGDFPSEAGKVKAAKKIMKAAKKFGIEVSDDSAVAQFASRNFKIVLPITETSTDEIERADGSKEKAYYLTGEASNTEIDLYTTIFSVQCQEGFVRDIDDGIINVRAYDEENEGNAVLAEAEHCGDDKPMDVLGVVDHAEITRTEDGHSRLIVRIRLDDKNPQAMFYYNCINDPDAGKGRPKQLGLSIRGWVIDARSEFNSELGYDITVLDRVQLTHIGIVRHPGNRSAWVKTLKRSAASLLQSDAAGDNKQGVIKMSQEEMKKMLAEMMDAGDMAEMMTSRMRAIVEELLPTLIVELQPRNDEAVNDNAEGLSQEEARAAEQQENAGANAEAGEVEEGATRQEAEVAEAIAETEAEAITEARSESEQAMPADVNADSLQERQAKTNNAEAILQSAELLRVDNTELFNGVAEVVERKMTEVLSGTSEIFTAIRSDLDNKSTELAKKIDDLSRRLETVEQSPATTPAKVIETQQATEQTLRDYFNKRIEKGDTRSAFALWLAQSGKLAQ